MIEAVELKDFENPEPPNAEGRPERRPPIRQSRDGSNCEKVILPIFRAFCKPLIGQRESFV